MPDNETPTRNAGASNAADRGTSGAQEPTGTAAVGAGSNMPESLEDERRLDGNAAGGALGAIFPFDMTMAMITCGGCGTRKPVGAVMTYMHGMGTILRCSMCDTVLMRVTQIRSHYYLDLRGVQVVEIAAEEDVRV